MAQRNKPDSGDGRTKRQGTRPDAGADPDRADQPAEPADDGKVDDGPSVDADADDADTAPADDDQVSLPSAGDKQSDDEPAGADDVSPAPDKPGVAQEDQKGTPPAPRPVIRPARAAAAPPEHRGGTGVQLLSPGVYVFEVASAGQPISPVGTSTAAFVGAYTIPLTILEKNPSFDPDNPNSKAYFERRTATQEEIDAADRDVRTAEQAAAAAPDDAALARRRDEAIEARRGRILADKLAKSGEAKMCANFGDFKRYFGDFSDTEAQRRLALAVYGFFHNGGSKCYVMRFDSDADLGTPGFLDPFAAIDEIALVAAPGVDNKVVQNALVDHCYNMGDRFAILDLAANLDPATTPDDMMARFSPAQPTYAAIYYPHIKVFDPVAKMQNPKGDGLVAQPPSGHIAGIYARVDNTRGVHKAPANEAIMGAEDVVTSIPRAVQDGLNPRGINCIRKLNNKILVWGARTYGGNSNGEYKYINVRRTMLFLRESIEEGTQWVVFEPNTRDLWAKIVRNVSAFLTQVWRDGALFGSTPAEAFFVKCDDELNPPEDREIGKVTCQIGVAIVRPAEFVIFQITQWAGPGKAS